MRECIEVVMHFLETTVLGDYGNFMESGNEYRTDANSFKSMMEQIADAIKSLEAYIEQIVNASNEIDSMVTRSADSIYVIAEKSGHTQSVSADGYDKLQKCREAAAKLDELVKKFRI